MKNRLTILPISMLLLVCFFFTSYGQESDNNLKDSGQNNLDPRKYISIYEVDKNTGKSMIVWNGNEIDQNSTNVVPQKVRTVDLNSELKIIFDAKKLKTMGLSGNISLQATVGERRIEVNPYSLIGQSQVNYGIKSKPISDLSRSLIQFSKNSNILHGFLMEMSGDIKFPARSGNRTFTANEIIGYLRQFETIISTYSDTTNLNLKKLFDDNLVISNKKNPDSLKFNEKSNHILELVRAGDGVELNNESKNGNLKIFKPNFQYTILNFGDINYVIALDIFKIKNSLTNDLISFLNNKNYTKKDLVSKIEQLIDGLEKKDIENLKDKFDEMSNYLSQFIMYYDFYMKDEDDTKATVLSILGTDNLSLTNLFIELKEFQKIIQTNPSTISFNQFNKLSNQYAKYIERVFNAEVLLPMFGNLPPDYFSDSDRKNNYNIDSDDDTSDSVIRYINEFLANQFVTATIDLKKAGVKEGETLSITMLWSKSFKTKSDNEYDPLTVASFQVKELGWRLNVASSIILVNRPGIESNSLPNNYSPSRFKGSPGVSLLATYTGLKERSGSFLERLSPSFGLNVSYLDFDTSKDVEIGAGLILGLFRNRVFFTYGFNLNVPDKPGYIGVGFSFAEIIAEVVKPSK